MSPSDTSPRIEPGFRNRLRRPEIPSWLGSMLLHALALFALAMAMRYAPQRGTTAERSAEVGIALKHTDGQTEYFETEEDAGEAESTASDSISESQLLAEVLSDTTAEDPSDLLPKTTAAIGPNTIDQGGGPLQPGAARGAPPGAGGFGGKAAVNVFGTQGVGYKFAYVFDRSLSMEGSGRSPLEVAKAEMIASLDTLEDTHQFQIVFYNETPKAFNPSGQTGKLAFATEQNKERARRFIGSITAYGRTEHETALELAIRMQPDVIFFLADADEYTVMGPAALAKIKRRSAGITINTIEFGMGPRQGNSFLMRLAHDNGGQHRYIDVRSFGGRL